MEDFEQVLGEVTIGAFEEKWIGSMSSGAKIAAGAGVDAAALAGHVSAKAITAGAKFFGTATHAKLAEFREGMGKIFWRRTARTALMKTVGELRLPVRS
jgi:hypothetical protein